ncbi:MAG: catechol 2,3-dioxygenase [Rhodospirillaceae bacterium]|nr:catechol 2,3-dioxygenase [Rhodospirillaceae bacterium]MBT5779742.1 catechol 2,3-dioxygenase [Rhodospirillaceae bacterium]
MALTGVLRAGFVQFRVLEMDEALAHYVDHIGLELVEKADDGRAYLKGYDEFDRHSIVLREADAPGVDVMAFKVGGAADLDTFEKRITDFGLAVDHVAAGEQPTVGRRIGFELPSGHRIELYAEMARSDNGPITENPDIWRDDPHGMRALGFDHCLLYGPNVAEVTRFFTEVLDFGLVEKVQTPDGPIAVWLTSSTKSHEVAFVEHPEPGKFHHVSFLLESWNDVGHAADIISRYDISRDVGPTRHGITRGQTIYFFDPSGNRNEVFAGGYSYFPDHPTRVWTPDQLGKGIFYYEKELNDRFLGVVT